MRKIQLVYLRNGNWNGTFGNCYLLQVVYEGNGTELLLLGVVTSYFRVTGLVTIPCKLS